ncbi:MAG: HNH endonuclease [Acidobacteriota bacterium]|nr:HNH endonuclease [Blastocatellia bacterium]MDW8412403.1 HNH endonuclease [Acidobacteriota bacterium]
MFSKKVLLLNASYEALGMISAPRAVRLMWKGAVEVLEYVDGMVLRSPRYTFSMPSVIRLKNYVDIHSRRRRSASKRLSILMRDRYRCQYCGRKGTAFELTIDHILPRSRGGQTVPENLCAACFECNQRKGDRTPEEARMPLLSNPSAFYYGLDRAILAHAAESRPEWRKYLFLEDAGVAAS